MPSVRTEEGTVVLVRNTCDEEWKKAIYIKCVVYPHIKYITESGEYNLCLPLQGYEYLEGSRNAPDCFKFQVRR